MQPAIIWSLLSMAACLVYIYLGASVLGRNPTARTNRIFFALCLAFAFWSISGAFAYIASSEANARIAWQISLIGLTILPSISVHLVLSLSESKYLKSPALYVLLYLPGLLFLFGLGDLLAHHVRFLPTHQGWQPDRTTWLPWIPLFDLYTFLVLTASLLVAWAWGRQAASRRERQQARFFVNWGFVSMGCAFVIEVVFPAMGLHVPPVSYLTGLIWIQAVWYAVIKYNFMVLTPAVAASEIVDRITDLVALAGADGRIITINRQAEALLGYKAAELRGHHVTELVADPAQVIPFLDPVLLETDALKDALEITCVTKSGERLPVRVALSGVKNEQGALLGTAFVAQDLRQTRQLQAEIAEREAASESLREANEKLKELDKMKTDFLSTVSHELRTPLTSVLGFARIIKRRLEEVILPSLPAGESKVERGAGQVRLNVEIIIHEGERLTHLINDVLDIAKLEAGRVEWKPEPLTVGELIDQAIAAMNAQAAEKGLTLLPEVPPGLPEVVCDRERMLQVLTNLLSNAIKFTPAGQVRCQAEREGDGITIRIIDQGIGIAEENLEQVFEKFKQVGDTLTDKPMGTGLGLPICRQIISHHGGRIWAESRLGEGSTFAFTLPLPAPGELRRAPARPVSTPFPALTEAAVASQGSIPQRADGQSGAPSTILVVDDHPPIRAFLRQVLEEVGYRVTEAADGNAAIQTAARERPDLIVMDVMMPGLSGFDAASFLKNQPDTREIPIVIFSVLKDEQAARQAGVQGYLVKPIESDDLLSAIKTLLSHT